MCLGDCFYKVVSLTTFHSGRLLFFIVGCPLRMRAVDELPVMQLFRLIASSLIYSGVSTATYLLYSGVSTTTLSSPLRKLSIKFGRTSSEGHHRGYRKGLTTFQVIPYHLSRALIQNRSSSPGSSNVGTQLSQVTGATYYNT